MEDIRPTVINVELVDEVVVSTLSDGRVLWYRADEVLGPLTDIFFEEDGRPRTWAHEAVTT